MESLKDYQFNWSLEPGDLRELYEDSGFDAHFYKFIAARVIAVLSPQLVPEPHNLNYDDELVHSRLIGPLERFIFGLADDAPQSEVDKMLDYLKTLKQPTKMCHKVLKTGDVLFSCNDCGLDATCVVCIDCFHKSAHKDHNYRMSNTDGGGCCDCGDVEAWKQFPACSDHEAPDQPSLKLSDFEDVEKRKKQLDSDRQGILEKISLLPAGLASRYFLVCQASLYYARRMLLWLNYDSPPKALEVSEKQLLEEAEHDEATAISLKRLLSKDKTSKNWFTVLFNDEIHTYDYVIDQLTKIIKCSKMTASIMASSVSREGRSFIWQDMHKPCKTIRDSIACHRENGQTPLKVEVIHGSVLAHQAYALKLVEWIKAMASLCDGFRVLTAYTQFGPDDDGSGIEDEDYEDVNLLELMMSANTSLWKMARIDWNELFVSTLLTEYTFKYMFARCLTKDYVKLVNSFMEDDHDHSVSVLTMTTQLYTVPSLVCMLIEEENALRTIADMLATICRDNKREPSSMMYETRHSWDLQSLKRGFYIISDFRHLISVEPTTWTDGLRAAVIAGVKSFLNLLDSMQGMDSVRRQIGQHIEYEQEWETGMTLQSRLIQLISQLVKYCSHDELVLREVLHETQLRLVKDRGYKRQRKSVFGHTANCIQYDVSTLSVSIHLPLTRFAAALMLELMRRRQHQGATPREPYDESLVILVPAGAADSCSSQQQQQQEQQQSISMIDLMEPSLRTEVMIAQFRSGMWRRNGYSLVNTIIYFSGALMRREMYDRDILLLQECAATCDANEFMIHLLNKFNLFNWVTAETTRAPLPGPKAVSFYNDEEIMTQTMSLGEEFLQILLTIVGERYRVGVGRVTETEVTMNEIIQLLCISAYTRSEIAHKLYATESEIDCVRHVANLKRTSESSTGKYELKEELYARFNPFFYHYSRRHQSQALDAQLKRKRMAKEPLVCCPPPEPVELCPQFGNLNNLLLCDITLSILERVLRRAGLCAADSASACPTKAPIRFLASDLQLDQCLHLIGLGLHEQARAPLEFAYIEALHAKQITVLLKDCYETAKRSTDLVFWLMRRTVEIVGRLEARPEYGEGLEGEGERAARFTTLAEVRQLYEPILCACDTVKQESQRSNSELSARRRERIMAMMKAKQKSFMSNPETQQLAAETAKHEAPAQANSSRHTQQPPAARSSSSFVALRERAAATTAAAAGSSSMATPTSMELELDTAAGPSSSSASRVATTTTLLEDEHEEDQDERMDSESINDDEHEHDPDHEEATTLTGEPARAPNRKQLDCPVESFVGSSHLCILCRDEQVVGLDRPTMVLLAYVQRSAVLSKNRTERRIPNYALTPTNQLRNLYMTMDFRQPPGNAPDKYNFTSDNSWSFDASFMPADLFFGPYVSTCGHAMHYDCWKGFSDTITKRETSRPNRGVRHVSFELDKGELLCPLCECISNATIPLIPDFSTFIERGGGGPSAASSVFGVGADVIEDSGERLTAFLHALKGTVLAYKHIRHLSQHPGQESRAPGASGRLVATSPRQHATGKYMKLLQPTPINDVLRELAEREAFMLRDFIASTRDKRLPSTALTRTMLNCIQTLAERIHRVGLDLDKNIGDVHHARLFMMTSWAISYTIQANERAARFKGAPLFEDLESSRNLCLSSLVRFANSSMMIHQSDMIQSLLIQKLRYLLVGEEHIVAPLCCLDIDTMELFVSLFVMLQKLYSHISATDEPAAKSGCSAASSSSGRKSPVVSFSFDPESEIYMRDEEKDAGEEEDDHEGDEGEDELLSPVEQQRRAQQQHHAWTTRVYDHEYFRNLLHLMVLMNLLQVSITIQNDVAAELEETRQQQGQPSEPKRREPSETASAHDGAPPQQDTATKEYSVLEAFFRDIILASGHPCDKVPRVDEQFVSRVRRALLPFLRSCAIFLYQLSHVAPGERLTKSSAFREGKNFAQTATAGAAHHQRGEQQAGRSEPSGRGVAEGHEHGEDSNQTDAEFEAVCQYLNLPTDFSILLRSKEARNLALTWLRHSRVLPLIRASIEEAHEKIMDERLRKQQQPESGTGGSGRLRRISSSSGGGGGGGGSASGGQLMASTSRASSSSSLSKGAAAAQQQQQQQQQQPSISSELMPVKFIRQPHRVNRLIDLPYDYSELVDKVSSFTCPSIKNEDSRTPTMCLVCGVMLCSQSYCCQRDLNDLASNYKRALRRQEEARQRWLEASPSTAAAGRSGLPAGSSAPSSSGTAPGPAGGSEGAPGGLEGLSLAQAQQLISSASGGGGGPADFLPAILSNLANAAAAAATNSPPANIAALMARMANSPADLEANRAAWNSCLMSLPGLLGQQPVGSCTYHAHECSGGVGVFLRIRNCQILLLSGRSKGCYMPAPYIDDHGETDFGLMRGNPLHLNRQLYERLQASWMNHTIPEQISRTLEYSTHASNIHWHLH